MPKEQYADFCKQWGLAMNADDLECVVNYFLNEKRDPTETELRILDTYWSDHCRHTTFTTELEDIAIEDSFIKEDIQGTMNLYLKMRKDLGREGKGLNLMDMATIGDQCFPRPPCCRLARNPRFTATTSSLSR